MFDEYKNIWLFAEHSNGKPLPVYYEILTKATILANEAQNCQLCALVIGSSVGGVVQEVLASGADAVYYIDNKNLLNYNCETYTAVIECVIQEYKPSTFLFGATAMGTELAPTVAARVKTGLAAHCIDMYIDKDGICTFLVPAFGGKVAGEILVPNHRPQMATVRPGIFSANQLDKSPNAQTVELACPALPEPRISFVSYAPQEQAAQNLEEANLVIGCGRGVGTDANFQNIEKLARKLNALIAFTRPAVDMGWAANESAMVGISGKFIKPKIFLGFGISGAMHFVCGIDKSDMIISVNSDDKAKMFDVSDYKVTADSTAIINALLEALD